MTTMPLHRASRGPRAGRTWPRFVTLCCLGVLFVLPVYVMLVTALKPSTDVSLSTMWELPRQFSGGGFAEAWSRLQPNMLNSLLIVLPATVISCLIGAINGYLFSKWRFRGSDVLFTLLVFAMFIPYQSILIPLVRFLQAIALYGSIPGLIVVHVVYGLPIVTLIFRNYFTALPNELIEAARVDGAGVMATFRRIVLPLALPGFVVAGAFQFTNIWNDFLFGVVIVPNPRAQPVTVALNNLSGTFSVDWNVVMAGSLVAGLPTAIVYVLLGRYLVRGLMAGSVKG
jgi:glucose/mannose transport system permease protein